MILATAPFEERNLRDVPNLASILILVQLQMSEVFLQRVANHNLVVEDLLQL